MLKTVSKRAVSALLALSFAVSVCLLPACVGTPPPADDGRRTVTFYTGDSAETTAVTDFPGEPIDAPGDPAREGYRFTEWLLNGKPFDFIMPAENVTVNAGWARIYTITFDTQTGQKIPAMEAIEGERIQSPEAEEKELVLAGYRFMGWLLDGKPFYFSTMPGNSIHLLANWEKAVTLTFETGYLDVTVNPITKFAGEPILEPAKPVKVGFKFISWLLNGATYIFTTMPAADTKLVASWVAGTTIFFNANAGEDTIDFPEFIVERAGMAMAEPVPARAGYYFEGWYLGSGNRYTFTTVPASNITLTARWVIASKLPAMCVTLHNENGALTQLSVVNRDNYVNGTINIRGEGGILSAKAEFKGRGAGSWDSLHKRPYRIKFEDKQKMFGFPSSRHWTLTPSGHNYPDDTMLVMDSAYSLCNAILDGMEYPGARTKIVDLYVNGAYRGVYVLADKVRVEGKKVDIESLHNAELLADGRPGNSDTGYLLNYTYQGHSDSRARFQISNLRKGPAGSDAANASTSSEWFSVKSPDPDDAYDPAITAITTTEFNKQLDFIRGKTQDLANVLISGEFSAYSNIADVASFVDNTIIQELYRNTDVGAGGYYLYRKPGAPVGDGKFYAGPPWDFDRTCNDRNATTGNNRVSSSGFGVTTDAVFSNYAQKFDANPLITYAYAMPQFKAAVVKRWKEVSQPIKDFITEYFDEYLGNDDYKVAFGANYVRWNNGREWDSTTPKSQEQAEADWLAAALAKKAWLLARCDWLSTVWV